jgi:uncharacterized protein (TIGR02594 family)
MMKELPWIDEGRKHIGLREDVSHSQHHPTVVQWLNAMGKFTGEANAWWRDDETPWCGLFVGYCLGVSGRFVVREWYRASAWQTPQMTRILRPAYGSIVVMARTGGGHVGFVVGVDQRGNIMVLGGNQGNAVSIAPFSRERLLGATYWWPSIWRGGAVIKAEPLLNRYALPVIHSSAPVSRNEA